MTCVLGRFYIRHKSKQFLDLKYQTFECDKLDVKIYHALFQR